MITIDGNGLWNGEIGFSTKKATVNEDQSAQGISCCDFIFVVLIDTFLSLHSSTTGKEAGFFE